MVSLIKQLSVHWDLWTGPYRAFFPTSEEDEQACRSLLATEGQDLSGIEESEGCWAACEESAGGTIIGCLRLADAVAAPEVRDHFLLIGPDKLEAMALITHLTFPAGHRKPAAINILLSHCFIEILKAGGQGVLMLCGADDFSTYRRLGMRPVSPPRKTIEGSLEMPMLFLPDQDYLSIINSPVLPLLRGVDFRRYESVCRWYYQLVRKNNELQTGSGFYPDSEEELEGHHVITEDLSDEGRDMLLQNAMVLKCREGEVLITENDTGTAFGFVRQGMVKVVIGGKTVVHLGKGDIFGEIAYILHSKRTAQVVAASPQTEVVLFSESALNELERESDRTIVWRNLARVLAQRVILTNKLLD